MPATPAQLSDFITEVREAARKLLAFKDDATRLGDDYASLNVQAELTQAHFVGENDGISVADFNAAVVMLGQVNADLKAGAPPTKMTKAIKIS